MNEDDDWPLTEPIEDPASLEHDALGAVLDDYALEIGDKAIVYDVAGTARFYTGYVSPASTQAVLVLDVDQAFDARYSHRLPWQHIAAISVDRSPEHPATA